MRRLRHAMKLTGLLSLAVMALAVFSATAQAKEEFTIGGKTFAELKITEETVSAEAVGAATLLPLFMGIEIKCGMRALDNIVMLGTQMHGLLDWSGCTMLEDIGGQLAEIPNCPVANFTTRFLAVVRSVPGAVFLLFQPTEKGTFGTIKIGGESEECALPKEMKITGSYMAELGKESIKQTIKPGLESELFPEDVLKMGASKAKLTDTLVLSLSGANKGKAWGAI
jgi:hypothetical protein